MESFRFTISVMSMHITSATGLPPYVAVFILNSICLSSPFLLKAWNIYSLSKISPLSLFSNFSFIIALSFSANKSHMFIL